MADHRWGINWLKYHQEGRHFEHIERMQYKSIKVFEWMWNNRDFCDDLLASAPKDCLFIARDIPLSHQHDGIEEDPVGRGRYHAQQWAEKLQRGEVHLPMDRTYFQPVNEYDENGKEAAFNLYQEAFITELYQRAGAKAAAYVFGTGHPSTYGRVPETDPNWEWYATSAAALIEHDGIACLHEYGAPHSLDWGNHIGRSIHCPYPFTVIYDEFGIDWGIVESGNLLGYLAFVGQGKPFSEPKDYVKWLDNAQATLIGGLKRAGSKLTVHSLQLFTFDSDDNWKTFDTRPIMADMENYGWTWVDQTPPPPASPPPKKVLNIPLVTVPGIVPSKDEQEENWQRAIDFVLGWEGGYVNDPNDPGGETNWGISHAAHPHLDIANLTREEAMKIYRTEYWEESGANEMDWPLCLVHFDTYVQNKAVAPKFLARSGGNVGKYLADRLRWYASLDDWRYFGRGWSNRISDLIEEATR